MILFVYSFYLVYRTVELYRRIKKKSVLFSFIALNTYKFKQLIIIFLIKLIFIPNI